MNKFRKIMMVIKQLTISQLIIILSSTILSPVFTLYLKLFGLKKTLVTINKLTSVDRKGFKPYSDRTQLEAKNIAYSVKFITTHHIFKVSCLSQTLLCFFWLNIKKIPSKVVVGVHFKKRSLAAHAWVEYNKHPLNDSLQAIKDHSMIYMSN